MVEMMAGAAYPYIPVSTIENAESSETPELYIVQVLYTPLQVSISTFIVVDT